MGIPSGSGCPSIMDSRRPRSYPVFLFFHSGIFPEKPLTFLNNYGIFLLVKAKFLIIIIIFKNICLLFYRVAVKKQLNVCAYI